MCPQGQSGVASVEHNVLSLDDKGQTLFGGQRIKLRIVVRSIETIAGASGRGDGDDVADVGVNHRDDVAGGLRGDEEIRTI